MSVDDKQQAVTDQPATLEVADPTSLSDPELLSHLRQLEQEELSISKRRTTLHGRIDFVRAGGFASNGAEQASLADLQAAESELSDRRTVLHAQIDALRAEQSRRRI